MFLFRFSKVPSNENKFYSVKDFVLIHSQSLLLKQGSAQAYKNKKKTLNKVLFRPTYTVFLSWRSSLEENSQRTSRKARFGGGYSDPLGF